MIVAGIDIGTNTLLMTIADVAADGTQRILHDEHAIVRLGEDLSSTGVIGPDAVERAASVLAAYADILNSAGAVHVRAVATSAMRDAANAADVRRRLESALGHTIDVISGVEEAALTFRGAVAHHAGPVIVIDIGGGSTECSYGQDGTFSHAVSVDVGVVRLTDHLFGLRPISDEVYAAATALIDAAFREPLSTLPSVPDVVAVAGTPVALAALELGVTDADQAVIEGTVLSSATVSAWADRLRRMRLDELAQLPGIHPRRADVLPAGTLILSEILRLLHVASCTVSTRGLRYGAMMSATDTQY